jgi:hypothetical protein
MISCAKLVHIYGSCRIIYEGSLFVLFVMLSISQTLAHFVYILLVVPLESP